MPTFPCCEYGLLSITFGPTPQRAGIDVLEAQGFELGKLLLSETAEHFLRGLTRAIGETQLPKLWGDV